MSEGTKEFLEMLEKLSPKKQDVMYNFMYLLVYCSDFVAAYDALFPPGAEAPPWEEVDKLVAEWMAKRR